MKNLLPALLARGAGLAVGLAGLVLTYNLLVPVGGRVGLLSMRTGVLPLAGPVLLVAGGLVLLVTRISRRAPDASERQSAGALGRRPAQRNLGDAGSPQGEGGWRPWGARRVS